MQRVGLTNRSQFGLEYSTLVKLQPKENVDCLLFDIELDEKKRSQTAPIPLRIGQRIRSALTELSRASDPVGVKLTEDIERAKLGSDNVSSPVEFYSRREDTLANALREMGYEVEVLSYSMLSKPGDSGLVGGRGFPSDHKYLSIFPKVNGDFEREEFIVELNFREQFVIQNPPVRYEEVLQLVPQEFVGTVDNLNHLIPLLCDEMARAFASRRQFLPPWRSCEVLKARWTGSCNEPGAAMSVDYDFEIGANQVETRADKGRGKGKVSLLTSKLAEMKEAKSQQTRKMRTAEMQKKVLSQVANLQLTAKIGKCGVQVDKDEMRKVWANALLTQIHRGWFGHS